MERIFVFVLGLIAGSFLNVLIYRLPRNLEFIRGRSFCPKCRRNIKWFDNIPLLSFILLRGRCRNCQSPISWKYPIVELLTGLITLIIFKFQIPIFKQIPNSNFQTYFSLFLSLLLAWGLIVIFFVDLNHQIIPDEILVPLIILFSLHQVFPLPTSFSSFPLLISHFQSFVVATCSFLFLYSIYLITKGKGMGFGDVKLAFLMGLVLGYPKIIVAFYLAFLTGAFFGVILIIIGKKGLKSKVAFGPFLCLATLIAYIWGEKIFSTVKALL